MPTYVPPKINTEFIFYIQLEAAAGGSFQSNPTIASGDFIVSTDGGATGNLATLPVVTPASGKGVKVTLSTSEMNGDNIRVEWNDAAGSEWLAGYAVIQTSANHLDDIKTETANILADTATLGSPVGADFSADIASVQTDTTAIVADTNELQADWTNTGRLDTILDSILADTGELQTNQGNWLTATGFSTHAATDIVSAGAITTLAGAIVNVDLVDTTTTNTDMVSAAPTAGANAIAVWDAVQSSHVVVGSFGIIASEIASILVDTTEIGAAGAGLTNINLPNQTMDITGNLSGSVGSVSGHTAQTGDTYALANGTAGFVAIDTVVDAVKVKTDSLTYTKAGEVDANIQSVNGQTVTGDGGSGTEWSGA